MIRVQKCICEIYSRVQLESVGFRFGKCAKDKKITLLAVDILEELLNEVPRRNNYYSSKSRFIFS